jgi:molybdate transport system substrate-binding protein
MTRTAVASAVVLVAAVAGLRFWARPGGDPPLVVAAAAATRPALEPAAADFTRRTGRAVELRFGGSGDLLAQLRTPGGRADLYLPIDESYTREARAAGVIDGAAYPVGSFRAAVLVAPGNPKGVRAWGDLARPGVRVAVPAAGAGVGKLARDHLQATGRWDAMSAGVVETGNVTDAANACRTGGVDAAIVWREVAAQPAYAGQEWFAPAELAGVAATAEVAVVAGAADPAAARALAAFLADPDGGLRHFRAAGFGPVP